MCRITPQPFRRNGAACIGDSGQGSIRVSGWTPIPCCVTAWTTASRPANGRSGEAAGRTQCLDPGTLQVNVMCLCSLHDRPETLPEGLPWVPEGSIMAMGA